ncbi:MAG: RNA polymerase sigma factor region1.1 domain-containing protein [Lachnospiraceae bacterium]|nr:RNA polymerase sigma factor region1.1 domain-containing protein [Lachnospiraceae bacterium]
MTQQEFQEKLMQLMSRAMEQGNQISREAVEEDFSDGEFEEEQLNLVYDFLLSRGIRVEGYEKQQEEEVELSPEAEAYLKSYEEELAAVKVYSEQEIDELILAVRRGEDEPRERLAEAMLKEIPSMARNLYHPDVLMPDLIQEGNLFLVIGINNLIGRAELDPEEARRELLRSAREGMETLSEQLKDVKQQNRRMVGKVEELKDNITVLKDELGRKVFLDELAQFMDISEDEAADILKLAGEDVPEDEEDTPE